MPARLMILNGPNLNLLGVREPHIYGTTTLAAIEASCQEFAKFLGVTPRMPPVQPRGRARRSDPRSARAGRRAHHEPCGLLLHLDRPARRDQGLPGPFIEVHISNIHARDEHHRHSKLSNVAKGVICGLGPYGYIVAMQAAVQMVGKLPEALPLPVRIGPR